MGLFRHVDPERVRREARHEAAFEAVTRPGRQLHEEERVAEDAVVAELLMESLGKPTPRKERGPTEKAKKAQTFTCKACTTKYTDGSGSGSGTKYNCEYCSSKCRAAKKAPRKCEHGRRPSQCRDCGTGQCQHGLWESNCKDCVTGCCEHGREKGKCKDCGTGHCEHGLWKSSNCKGCGKDRCDHGRKKSQCKDHGTDTCKHVRQDAQ
jgi:hypothetical protein